MKRKKNWFEKFVVWDPDKDEEHSFLIYLGFAAMLMVVIMMIVGSAYGS